MGLVTPGLYRERNKVCLPSIERRIHARRERRRREYPRGWEEETGIYKKVHTLDKQNTAVQSIFFFAKH